MKVEDRTEQKQMPIFFPFKHHKRSLKGRKCDLVLQIKGNKKEKD